jgi:hypothetical protein
VKDFCECVNEFSGSIVLKSSSVATQLITSRVVLSSIVSVNFIGSITRSKSKNKQSYPRNWPWRPTRL